MAQITLDNQSAPTTPAAGRSVKWVDSTSKKEVLTDDSGRHLGNLSRNDATASQTLGTADTYVTNSGLLIPGFGMKAGQFYRWLMFITKTAASTAVPTYNFRIGAAQAVGDTSRALLTSVAQTAAVDGGLLILTCQVRNVGASGVLGVSMSFSGKVAANAVGFGSSALDLAASSFDNTGLGGQYLGISINPGASSSWVITSVFSELIG